MDLPKRHEESRVKIAMSFMELAKTKHLSKISIKDIMLGTGMARQKFYAYFEDINDLLRWVTTYGLKEAFNTFFYYDKDVRNSFVNALQYMNDNRQFFRNLQSDNGFGPFETALYNWCLDAALFHIGRARLSDKELFYLKFYERGIANAICEWIKGDTNVSLEMLATYLTDLMPPAIKKYY